MRLIPLISTILLLCLHSARCNQIKSSLPPVSHTGTKPRAVINGVKNCICSGLAAACAKTLLAPFDTIKTVQQQAIHNGKALGISDAANIIVSRPKGFLELYAGLGVAAVGAMPSVGLYFGVYSYSKEKILPFLQQKYKPLDESSVATLRTISIAASAAIGNTVASFSRVPYEVVKQKLQTGEYSSTFGAMKHMFNTDGMRAFFPMGGVRIQMIRDIPYAVVTLLAYENIRLHWVQKRDEAAWRDVVAGAVAGGVGSYATNPMDVIKTRLQVDSAAYGGSVWECTKSTFAEGGPNAFLRGSVPRLIHKIPANGAFFFFYEFFRRLLRVEDSPKGKK